VCGGGAGKRHGALARLLMAYASKTVAKKQRQQQQVMLQGNRA